MLIDLHVHSHLSRDCPLDPKQVLARAETFGLDGVAFTETNTQDGCDELFDLQKSTKLRIFVGLELATDKGLRLRWDRFGRDRSQYLGEHRLLLRAGARA